MFQVRNQKSKFHGMLHHYTCASTELVLRSDPLTFSKPPCTLKYTICIAVTWD